VRSRGPKDNRLRRLRTQRLLFTVFLLGFFDAPCLVNKVLGVISPALIMADWLLRSPGKDSGSVNDRER